MIFTSPEEIDLKNEARKKLNQSVKKEAIIHLPRLLDSNKHQNCRNITPSFCLKQTSTGGRFFS